MKHGVAPPSPIPASTRNIISIGTEFGERRQYGEDAEQHAGDDQKRLATQAIGKRTKATPHRGSHPTSADEKISPKSAILMPSLRR